MIVKGKMLFFAFATVIVAPNNNFLSSKNMVGRTFNSLVPIKSLFDGSRINITPIFSVFLTLK